MTKNIPKHVAIIMDGNRRWAKTRGLNPSKGHAAGVNALEKIVEAAIDLGIETLTVYALSTENIHERAKDELGELFALVSSGFRQILPRMMKNGVKPQVLGELAGLPIYIRKIVQDTNKKLVKNQKIKLNLAFNYGGKREVISAVIKLVKEGSEINEENLAKNLYTAGQVDPDLIIRTGGNKRLSNFLMWQTGYSEIYFSDVLWPDFSYSDLKTAVGWFGEQKRNFGK